MIVKKKILFFVPFLLAISMLSCGKNTSNDKTIEMSETMTADDVNLEQEETEEKGVQFPFLLENGKLEVESIFQFEGINPDCNNLEGTDIAAITVGNISDEYLKNAVIEAFFDDGKKYTFVVDNLPAGKNVIAFVIDNAVLPADAACVELRAETQFEQVTNADNVLVSVEGMEVTIENTADEELMGIDVYCRNVFYEQYFGGMAYKYTIEKIPAGESQTITATDSILGVVEVVYVDAKQKN